jgi:hypothetical protein
MNRRHSRMAFSSFARLAIGQRCVSTDELKRRKLPDLQGLEALHMLRNRARCCAEATNRKYQFTGGGLQPQTDIRPGTVVVHCPLQVTLAS